MDDGNLDLVNHMFAIATALLEDAVEAAIAGQSSRLSHLELVALAGRLQIAAREIAAVADATMIVASLGAKRG